MPVYMNSEGSLYKADKPFKVEDALRPHVSELLDSLLTEVPMTIAMVEEMLTKGKNTLIRLANLGITDHESPEAKKIIKAEMSAPIQLLTETQTDTVTVTGTGTGNEKR